jgi:hypothetical protein
MDEVRCEVCAAGLRILCVKRHLVDIIADIHPTTRQLQSKVQIPSGYLKTHALSS